MRCAIALFQKGEVLMRYWITYNCATYGHTRREYGETTCQMDIFRRYYEIAKTNHVYSVDIETIKGE